MWVNTDEQSDRWNLNRSPRIRGYGEGWPRLALTPGGGEAFAGGAVTGKNWRYFDLISCVRLRFTCVNRPSVWALFPVPWVAAGSRPDQHRPR